MFSKNSITGYMRIPRYRLMRNLQDYTYFIWDDKNKDYYYYPEGHACKEMMQVDAESVYKSMNLGNIYK